jgi:hypothetical protein
MAMNMALPFHKDRDFFMGIVGILGALGYHERDDDASSVLQFFCFGCIYAQW